MVRDPGVALGDAQVALVSLVSPEIVSALSDHHNDGLTVVDLAGLPRAQLKCARYHGICW
jgi:hypothetical protein